MNKFCKQPHSWCLVHLMNQIACLNTKVALIFFFSTLYWVNCLYDFVRLFSHVTGLLNGWYLARRGPFFICMSMICWIAFSRLVCCVMNLQVPEEFLGAMNFLPRCLRGRLDECHTPSNWFVLRMVGLVYSKNLLWTIQLVRKNWSLVFQNNSSICFITWIFVFYRLFYWSASIALDCFVN